MRFIHCADLHLDSKMSANLDSDKAKERKAELLLTFERMVAYAVQHEVGAILIAGDLFDTRNVSAAARNSVYQAISGHPQVMFYYLRGNHDSDNFLSLLETVPSNLKLFADQWTAYPMDESGKVMLYGLELSAENQGTAYTTLVLNEAQVNIVTLHGQESASLGKDKTEIIDLRALKNKGIDYLALGHIHAQKVERLDARGIYCYSGCLEGRGFDECGEHGFYIVDIDEQQMKVSTEFVPFAKRMLYEVHVDLTGCMTTPEAAERMKEALATAQIGPEHLVKVVLDGALDVEAELDCVYLLKNFEPDYYFLKIYNETKTQVLAQDYALEMSLKGEFVRTVLAEAGLSEEDRASVIRFGLQALSGEEIGD